MPFYVGDYLGDTQRLTTEQHGAYLLLILDYWRNGPAPDDDAVLRQIAKLDARTWKKHRAALSRLFQIRDGEWHHKRIEAELVVAAANAERRSSKARAAAEARWGQSSGDAASNASSMPQAMLGACPPPSPSPKKNSDPNGSGAIAPDAPPDPDKVMFDAGRRLLTAAGVSVPEAGRMLGKWRRDHGAEAVITALGKAQREGAIDPKSFIEGCLRNGKRPGHDRPSGPIESSRRFREQLELDAQRSDGDGIGFGVVPTAGSL
jgi:uncharacterized protein YdaU (DUF1376 family)